MCLYKSLLNIRVFYFIHPIKAFLIKVVHIKNVIEKRHTAKNTTQFC